MEVLNNILSHEIVHKLGLTLLHSLWQGGIVVLLLAVLLRIFQKTSANLRYVISCLGLAVIVMLPVVTFYIVPAPALTSDVESVPSFSVPVTGQLQEVYDADSPLGRATEYMQIFPAISWKQRAKNLCTYALPYIVFGWFIGVFALSLWHLGGWTHLQRLKRKNTNQVDASLKDKLNNLAERLKVTRPVKLMKSALVQIPTVVGCLRPVILLPASALTGLTSQQLEAVLAHELAHIRRYDYLVNMLQTVVEIVGFYHPAVWWISHKMRIERENCCDDLAVSVCGDKVGYARALTSMEEIRLAQGELVIAASGGNLFTRISRLVGNESAGKARPGWAPVVLSALLIIALAIPTTLALTAADSDSGLQTDSTTTHVSELLVDEENISNSVAAQPASHLPGTDSNIQLLFDCIICEVPADLKFPKDEPTKGSAGISIQLGREYANSLETLIQETKDAKILSAPRIMIVDGEEALVSVGADVPYVAGYENGEDAGDEAKPIIKKGFAGLELKIKGKTKENGLKIDLNINYRQLKPGLGTHKDDEGREIQVPVIESRECTAVVTVRSDETIVIGGLRSNEKPLRNLILMITPSIVLPEKGPEQAKIEMGIRTIEDGPVHVVEDFVDSVTKGRFVSPLKAVKKQMDELRELLDGQVFSVKDCGTEDNTAMVIYKLEKEDNGKEVRWQVVFKLVKENGQWLIDDIDFASLGGVKKKLTPPAQKPTEKEVDSARELEALRQAQEYMKALHLYSPKSEQSRMLEQLKVVLALEKSQQEFHENLNLLAASCAERGDFAKAAEYQEMAIKFAKTRKYYGIGIAIEKKDGLIRISAVLPNTPASGSSFQKGDIIEAVDGISTEGLSLDDVVARIVGPKGTEVTLSVKSHSQDVAEKKTFTRQLLLEGSHVLRAYEWRLAAYKSGKTWPQYRRGMEDQKAQRAGAPRIFEIKYADAEELAQVLNRVLERRWKGINDKTVDVVRIIPHPDTNRLIVIASPADNRLIEALITELDVL
ncbi:MAG: M56 family metallopeptidase, partial [Planctomycetota bacterium]